MLDADIAKCFDRIDHKALLNKINYKGKVRRQIKAWLKSGVVDQGTFTAVSEGTPQGGIISPLLANIASYIDIAMTKKLWFRLKIIMPKQFSLLKIAELQN